MLAYIPYMDPMGTYITYKKAPLNRHVVPFFKTSQDLEARTQESLNQFIDSQAQSEGVNE